MPIVSRKKEKGKAKDGEQYARFIKAAERIGPYDESILDEAVKKIVKAKPQGESPATGKPQTSKECYGEGNNFSLVSVSIYGLLDVLVRTKFPASRI